MTVAEGQSLSPAPPSGRRGARNAAQRPHRSCHFGRRSQGARAELRRRSSPPRCAMRHIGAAPGSGPRSCMSVALACGDDRPGMTDAACAALELIHCASLVHDDMPCFDDADTRRGQALGASRLFRAPCAGSPARASSCWPSRVLAHTADLDAQRSARLVLTLARRTGMPGGICAGQGWESEAEVNLSAYHRAKTGALFIAATQMGAIAAGQEPEPWERLGQPAIGRGVPVGRPSRDALYDSGNARKCRRQERSAGPVPAPPRPNRGLAPSAVQASHPGP